MIVIVYHKSHSLIYTHIMSSFTSSMLQYEATLAFESDREVHCWYNYCALSIGYCFVPVHMRLYFSSFRPQEEYYVGLIYHSLLEGGQSC